jgi:hypothetical protein
MPSFTLSRRSGEMGRPARPRNQDLIRPPWLRRASSDARHWIHDPAEYVDSATSRPVCSHLGSFRGPRASGRQGHGHMVIPRQRYER